MGTIWVKEFTGGLAARRLPEATAGGVLVKAVNGHITSGGEFEERAAFVEAYRLPADTFGLSRDRNGLYVFGSAAAPSTPVGVTYQRLQHADGSTAMSRLLKAELNAGKIYAVAEFVDGSIFHFYDGARVTDWYDGRARAAFDVTGGGITAAVGAVGSFEVTGGTLLAGVNKLSDLKINGVSIISGAVDHTGNNATTAAAIASAINSHSSTPDYTATSNGQTVYVTAATTGTAINGTAIVATVAGNLTTGNHIVMSGGAAAITSSLDDLKVNGVSLMASGVSWATSNEATATAIAAAINSHTSAPEYEAVASGTRVNIIAADPGADKNGYAVAFTLTNGFTVSPSTGLVMADGLDSTGTFQPGAFVKTIGSKMYSTSGENLHFSGIREPTKWTTDTVGAGFIGMSSIAEGLDELVAVAKYQSSIATFSEQTTQITYVDPDPTLNRQLQTLENTGTRYPNSVTQFGDDDLFYVDGGVRSLRSRDSSNAASTTDIGVPIDTLVRAALDAVGDNELTKVIGCIEPREKRFWLSVKDQIFVFSFFNGAKVSAWSTYLPGFEVEDITVFRRRVYLRSGDTIYVYGGLGDDLTYDDTVAEAWLPYLDANAPTREKTWAGVDAALQGEWGVYAAMQPTNLAAEDNVATLFETTYNRDRIPSLGKSTHISMRFRSKANGARPAKLSAVVIHHDLDADED